MKGAVGVFARFHVDPNEVAEGGGAGGEAGDVVAALVDGEIEAKLRQFERDISLDAIGVNGFEGAQVDIASLGRFGQFSEIGCSANRR